MTSDKLGLSVFIYFKHQQFVVSSYSTTLIFLERKKRIEQNCIIVLNKLVDTTWNIIYPFKPSCIPKVCSRRCKISVIAVGLQKNYKEKIYNSIWIFYNWRCQGVLTAPDAFYGAPAACHCVSSRVLLGDSLRSRWVSAKRSWCTKRICLAFMACLVRWMPVQDVLYWLVCKFKICTIVCKTKKNLNFITSKKSGFVCLNEIR